MRALTKALIVLVPVALVALASTQSDPSRNLEWAGVQAEKHLAENPGAVKYEYTGIIVKRANGTYAWTAYPRTNNSVDSVKVNPKAMLMPGDTLAGLYHNHPCMPRTHFTHQLSKPDVMLTYIYGVPMFMLDMCTGDVHVYDPLRDHVKDTGVWVSAIDPYTCKDILTMIPSGRIVGNIGKTFPDMDAADPADDAPYCN